MKTQLHIVSATLLFAFVNTSTFAQQAQEPSEDVTVFAPYVVKTTTGPRNVQTVTVSRNVNYHDLDLAKPADVATLETRVNQAARDVCKELDSRYSSGNWVQTVEDRNCARNASKNALAEVQMIAAAARKS